MRYITRLIPAAGRWMVYDTLKEQSVWVWNIKANAEGMAAILEEIHTKKQPVAFPADVAQRLKTDAAVAELRAFEAIDRADRATNPVIKADLENEAARQRQRSCDLYTLLEAVGVELEE